MISVATLLLVASLRAPSVITTVEKPVAVKEKLPSEVRYEIEYAREMCRGLGEKFYFDEAYIDKADFNGDKRPDYLLDGRGYKCGNQTNNMFNSSSGKPLYLYISKPDGTLDKAFSGFVYEYRIKQEYGQLPFFDVWIKGEVGYQVNFLRHQWDGERLELLEQETGVEVPTQLWKRFD